MTDLVYSPNEPSGDRPVPDETLRGWPDLEVCSACGAELVDGVCLRCDGGGLMGIVYEGGSSR